MDDAHLNAIQKLQAVFDALYQLRLAHSVEIVKIARVWYIGDNALIHWRVDDAVNHQRSPSIGALVRHPMYVATFVMVIGIALGLGSWWALLFLAVQMPVLVIRILDEEKVLENELAGCIEYEQKVHYRLVPGIW